MSIELPLESMSLADKMLVLETVWASLCDTPTDVQPPEWHREILAERTRRLETGEAKVSSWEEAKKRLMKLSE